MAQAALEIVVDAASNNGALMVSMRFRSMAITNMAAGILWREASSRMVMATSLTASST